METRLRISWVLRRIILLKFFLPPYRIVGSTWPTPLAPSSCSRAPAGGAVGWWVQEVEASELKMRLDEALSVHRQAAARENEQQGYWQVMSCVVMSIKQSS